MAIVGAGWTGIGVMRQLREAGHDVHVYEQNDDVGGTWHPRNCYAGLSIHSYAGETEYPDYPLPTTICRTARITSGQIFEYLRAYCKNKGFCEHIDFNSKVDGIDFDSQSREVTVHVARNGRNQPRVYDYVVYTHGFAHRNIPAFTGREVFAGRVLHSLDFTDQVLAATISANKKIAVIGGSKSAADCVLSLQSRGGIAHWVYRKPYWFMKYAPGQASIGPPGALGAIVDQTRDSVFFAHQFLTSTHPRVGIAMLRYTGALHTYGAPHDDYRKFHYGVLDARQIEILREYARKHAVEGEVSHLRSKGVVVSTHDRGEVALDADVIVCCTGSGNLLASLPVVTVDGTPEVIAHATSVYRGRVVPRISNLIFTAYAQWTTGVSNGLTYGNWINRYIERGPDEAYLRRHSQSLGYPYFQTQSLFSSELFHAQQMSRWYQDLFKDGELSIVPTLRWLRRRARGHGEALTFNALSQS